MRSFALAMIVVLGTVGFGLGCKDGAPAGVSDAKLPVMVYYTLPN